VNDQDGPKPSKKTAGKARKKNGGRRGVMECRMAAFIVTTAWVLAACETQGVEATQSLGEAHVPQKAEAKTKPAVPQTYGQLRRPNGRVIPLATIAANPTRYEGRQVRTEGQIQRVCQKKGCWLELADAIGSRVFVPMGGHAFAVPMDSIGNEALVEGIVHRRERSHAERKHLKDDGAGDSIPALSIEANAVVIRQ
jgi:starvation-inducible outer membrane lipoprotein